MASLKKLGLTDAICQPCCREQPLFGICIGLQILFTGTEEGGWHECLNIIPGRVKKLPAGLKIPHMGWNQVKQKFASSYIRRCSGWGQFLFCAQLLR